MVSVAEATRIIQQHVRPWRTETVPLSMAVGRTLAVEVLADRDFPPFNRVAMDGIAIAFAAYEQGQRQFIISGVQAAGQPDLVLSDQKQCIEVMTGAMLPTGCDTVIRYEDLKMEGGVAFINDENVKRGQSIHPLAQDARQGDRLLTKGQHLSPAEIALLASVGKVNIEVWALPTTAIISTGDEVIDIGEQPLPHQIRRSNSYALQAAFKQLNVESELFHLADREEEIIARLTHILDRFELVILSGGVSKGKFDFIPAALEKGGVKKLFHRISQRPGKPLWFGTSPRNTVFALPGNPVSTFLCFHRYIKPWLLQQFEWPKAILAEGYHNAIPLTYFLQVKLISKDGRLMAYPVPGGGSGDFVNLKDVDGFLELPPETQCKYGEEFLLNRFRHLLF